MNWYEHPIWVHPETYIAIGGTFWFVVGSVLVWLLRRKQ